MLTSTSWTESSSFRLRGALRRAFGASSASAALARFRLFAGAGRAGFFAAAGVVRLGPAAAALVEAFFLEGAARGFLTGMTGASAVTTGSSGS